jgi:chaperone required for assembly of F1-ATPase
MQQNLKQVEKDIKQHRAEIIDRLVNFALNDALLFWSSDKDVKKEQQEKWLPILRWVDETLNARFKQTTSLEAEKTDKKATQELKKYLDNLSDKELTSFYIAALNMRSVLLAVAMIKGRINAAEAFELSELEELYQARKWGSEPVAEARRNSIKDSLISAEQYLRQ